MRIAGCQKFKDERLSCLDLNGNFLAGSQAVEERGRWQYADIRVRLAEFVVLDEDI